MTVHGFRPVRTVIPPSTACARTLRHSAKPSQRKSRRNGRRRRAPRKASRHGKPTRPVSRRLPNSMPWWERSGAPSDVSVHLGHVGQPRPEPVRRTAAPVKTMSVSSARAA
jgi:hypothetical protein